MENERLAKKVISVLLDQEVVELSLGQQETILPIEKRGLTLFRLDFKAIIKEADGTNKKVLIELQKSKFSTDIQRFRNYLGANYISKNKKHDEGNIEKKNSYPIITIYILGYNMDDLPYLAVKVNREIIDSSNNKPVNVKSFFIEHLTHQSHIIQVRRLPEERSTRLEKFLTLFNQAWISDENYILDLQDVPDEFKDMAKFLQGPVMNDTFRRQLEVEEEIDTLFDEQEAKFLKKIEEVKQRETEERRQKEEAIEKEKELAIKFARQLNKFGISINEISSETGIDIDMLKKIL
jgi:hypothetical protein